MIRSLLLSIPVLLAPSAAFADPTAGRISGTIFGGTEIPVGGTLHGGTASNIPNLGPLNPALNGVTATLGIEDRSQEDVYDKPYVVGGELAYGLSDDSEILGQLRYTKANGNRIQVGAAAAGAPVNASLPVFGTFGDYESFEVTAGYRQYIGTKGGVRPYIAARAGAANVQSINATFEIPDAAITIANAPFYKNSWVFSGGGDFGLSIPFGEAFSIQAETGIRYTAKLRGDDSALAGLGLQTINDVGDRWTVPFMLRAKLAF